jgi:hypothetical protein
MLYDSLDREKASILAQLPTGHARLNGYLHRIGKIDGDLYECGVERETVPHSLLQCRAWKPDVKIVRAGIAFAMETGRLAPEG